MAERTVDRMPREAETRTAEQRPMTWKRPSLLPDPEPRDGWVFRWIRTASSGQSDPMNASARFREGWVPVKKSEHPEFGVLMHDINSRFPENIELGGHLLCKMPAEMAAQRDDYYRNRARQQLQSVDNNWLRENDPRMPVLKPERRTVVTVGGTTKVSTD